jgi:erythromycin esterase
MLRPLLLLLALLAFDADAAPRRRASAHPGSRPVEATPAGWLAANAHVLNSIELVPDRRDLFPLRSMIGSAEMVGLGDVTHGTHEFYTVKLRVIDYLVREMDFDVLAFEAPYPLFERLNVYVQGGVGDPRAILAELRPMTYFFWDVEEIVALVEWMREYNAHRGDRPALQLVGADVTQPDAASNAVVEYLRVVDPPAAVEAEQRYACARESSLRISGQCATIAESLFDALAAREAELTARSSAREFAEALYLARVVVQSRWPFGPRRDLQLAANALWIRDHRSATGKTIIWAHSGHLSETQHPSLGLNPMGRVLSKQLGSDFFSITTLTAAGSFRQWRDPERDGTFQTFITFLHALDSTSYETYFRQHGSPYLLIPFRNVVPEWLTTPARYNFGGVGGEQGTIGSLPMQYDAAIFIDTTTPVRPIVR